LAGDIYGRLPENLTREVNKYYPNGGRPRIAPETSRYNPNHIKDRNKEICQKREQGEKTSEIAQQINLTKRTIKRILKENGLAGLPDEKNDDQAKQVRIMIGMGYGVTKIARKIKRSRERVYQIIRREGL